MKAKLMLILALMMALLAILPASSALAQQKVLYNGIITRRYENSTTKVYREMDK